MDAHDYRRALGSFPTGVTIVTAYDTDHDPWGLTANSFTSVSLEPPVVSVCIAKSGRVFPTLSMSGHFTVNILSATQADISGQFASAQDDRFTGIHWQLSGFGLPLITGAAAHLECSVWRRYAGGDHEIIVGEVQHLAATDHTPLLYGLGRLTSFPSEL